MTFSYSYNGSKKYLGREKKTELEIAAIFLHLRHFELCLFMGFTTCAPRIKMYN